MKELNQTKALAISFLDVDDPVFVVIEFWELKSFSD